MSSQIFNPEKENTVFVRKLRLLFDKTRHTQQELIDFIREKTGKAPTRQAVSMWLHGNKPDIETLPVIAEFFGVTTDYMLTETNVSTLDIDLRTVCDYTGLSAEAVGNLRKVRGITNAGSEVVHPHLAGLFGEGDYLADYLISDERFVYLIELLTIMKKMVVEDDFYNEIIQPIIDNEKNEQGCWVNDVLPYIAPDYVPNCRNIETDLAEFKVNKLFVEIAGDVIGHFSYSAEEINNRSNRAYKNVKNALEAKEAELASTNSNGADTKKLKQEIDALKRFVNTYNEYLSKTEGK